MPPKKHGVILIEGKSDAWWGRQNIQVLKNQAELRGHRFSDLDTKGGMVKKDGKMMKSKRLSKADYLEVLKGLIAKGSRSAHLITRPGPDVFIIQLDNFRPLL